MRTKPRIGAAIVGILSILGLTGCATVSVQAQVFDNTHASFAIQKVVTIDGYKDYLAYEEALNEKPTEPSVDVGQILDLRGTWINDDAATNNAYNEMVISNDVKIYSLNNSEKILTWAGDYTPPQLASSIYSWESKKIDNPTTDTDDHHYFRAFNFNYEAGEISFSVKDDQNHDVLVRMKNTTVPAVETPVEQPIEQPTVPAKNTLTNDQLCESFKNDVKKRDTVYAGVEPEVECTDVDFAVTTLYNVEFDIGGITKINGESINSQTRDKLIFKFYPDPQYGDVVFETRIIGLYDGEFPTAQRWLESITDYKVSVTFPGEISGYNGVNSGAVDDGHTVTWNHETVAAAVENNVFILRAAGMAVTPADPMLYIVSIAGFIFLLSILLYFSWKRISPRKIAITSLILVIVSPFGLGMAIIALKKSRNDVEGGKLAFRSIILNGAVLVFEAIFITLTLLLSPQLIDEFLALFGL